MTSAFAVSVTRSSAMARSLLLVISTFVTAASSVNVVSAVIFLLQFASYSYVFVSPSRVVTA